VLERIARAGSRGKAPPVDQRKSMSVWAWINCLWPLLPILPAFLLGQGGLTVLAVYSLVSPAYAIWAGTGLLFAGAMAVMRSAGARAAIATNCVGLAASGVLMWAGYTGKIPIHWS
jgi:hypothetical protein